MGKMKDEFTKLKEEGLNNEEISKVMGMEDYKNHVRTLRSQSDDDFINTHTANRLYQINNNVVPSDIFIRELALDLYNHSEIKDIRETIDIICADEDGSQMITLNGKNYFSYKVLVTYTQAEPIKKLFEVSYDIEILPLVPKIFHKNIKKKWKRSTMMIEAESYSDAKRMVRDILKEKHPDQRTKNFEAVVSNFREVRNPSEDIKEEKNE